MHRFLLEWCVCFFAKEVIFKIEVASPKKNVTMDFQFDTGNSFLTKPKLQIRVQKRNGRKCITTVEGFEDDLDVKRICKAMRKQFNCNGNIVNDEHNTDVLQLQGDQRDNVKQWILENEVIAKNEADRIVVHGF